MEDDLTLYTKINSRWANNLNIRSNSVELLLKDNTWVNLHSFLLGNTLRLDIKNGSKNKKSLDKLDKI